MPDRAKRMTEPPPCMLPDGTLNVVDPLDVAIHMCENWEKQRRTTKKEKVMDPNACLLQLLQAIEARRWDEARESLSHMEQWIQNGGFQGAGIAAASAAVYKVIWDKKG